MRARFEAGQKEKDPNPATTSRAIPKYVFQSVVRPAILDLLGSLTPQEGPRMPFRRQKAKLKLAQEELEKLLAGSRSRTQPAEPAPGRGGGVGGARTGANYGTWLAGAQLAIPAVHTSVSASLTPGPRRAPPVPSCTDHRSARRCQHGTSAPSVRAAAAPPVAPIACPAARRSGQRPETPPQDRIELAGGPGHRSCVSAGAGARLLTRRVERGMFLGHCILSMAHQF